MTIFLEHNKRISSNLLVTKICSQVNHCVKNQQRLMYAKFHNCRACGCLEHASKFDKICVRLNFHTSLEVSPILRVYL
jgi:hypothetical protein